MPRRIVVIGSGAAGMTAASSARREDPGATITLLTEDSYIAYSPCVIPWVIEGLNDWDDIVMHDPEFYRTERDIEVVIETTVTHADREAKVVRTSDGVEYGWDSLVVATGGRVFIPPIEGKDLDGVFSVRTIDDGKAIKAAARDARRVVIVGAGVIGLEMALAFRGIGLDVTVVEMFDQVVPRILDADMASTVKAHLDGKGIDFRFGAPISAVRGDGRVSSVVVGDETIPCEMVIMATGVRANLDIPNMLGLDVGALGAVRVSPTMQPYSRGRLVRDVYLCGDVVMCDSAVVNGPTMSQLGSTAVRQGIVAGSNAAGARRVHPGVASPWVSVLGGIEVGGTGMSLGLASYYGIDVVGGVATGSTRARYYPGGLPLKVKVIVERGSRRIVGAQIVGGEEVTGRVNWLTAAIVEGVTVDEFAVYHENAYCPPTSMVRDVVCAAADDALDRLRV